LLIDYALQRAALVLVVGGIGRGKRRSKQRVGRKVSHEPPASR
jgi:hypothetical protein